MSIRSQLLDHAGHMLTIVEGRAGRVGMKCHSSTCDHFGRVVDLTPLLTGQPVTAQLPLGSAGPPQPPTKAEECPAHVGQHRTACGPCAGEAKAATDAELAARPIRSGADPATVPEVQAVKAQLAARAAARQRAARGLVTDPTAHPQQTSSGEGSTP